MTECRSPELQDLLPDYAAESLDDATTATVEAHLNACPWCADDLAVLRMVRLARPQVAMPDVARIVAALPTSPGAAVAPVVSRPTLVRDSAATLPPSLRGRSTKRGLVFGMSVWRLAATLGVVIAGGMSVVVARQGVVGVEPGSDVARALQVAESAAAVARASADGDAARSGAETGAMALPAASTRGAAVSVSYGDLGDYSEEELQRMLDRLDKWDGVTSTEPLPGVPLIASRGGESR